ncbi:hypothetical protein [Cyanobium sp. CH-040]|uniref:hypothetical protein n=1 Tax=Cyanobium sp. CH-040 TaxID=2823708 RepID=UPI0020CE0E06|nr:hypothetical protein [Cyanobium sp. CH-040]MCP9926864.1 hypothetical protein [Cyanobium sp. CH-040]
MLPAPRPPAQFRLPATLTRWTRPALRSLAGAALALLLLLPLAGCAGAPQPPRGVLLRALALQIQLTQSAIAQALDLASDPDAVPQVSRVRVSEQQALRIGEARGLRLVGQFDWRLPGDPIRVDSPFELYLQRGERGQSWRLARPVGSADGSTQEWITDPLPLPG